MKSLCFLFQKQTVFYKLVENIMEEYKEHNKLVKKVGSVPRLS